MTLFVKTSATAIAAYLAWMGVQIVTISSTVERIGAAQVAELQSLNTRLTGVADALHYDRVAIDQLKHDFYVEAQKK